MTAAEPPPKHRRRSSPTRTALIAAAGGLAVLLAGLAWVHSAYADRVSPGVRVGDVVVGGLPVAEARARLTERMDAIENEGLVIQADGKAIPLDLTVTDDQGLGLTAVAVDFDAEATIAASLAVGHRSSPFFDDLERLKNMLVGTRVQPIGTVDAAVLGQAVTAALRSYETPAVEPGYALTKSGTVTVADPRAGSGFDHAAVVSIANARVLRLDRTPIVAERQTVTPRASRAAAERLLPQVRRMVAGGSLVLTANDQEAKVSVGTYIGWLIPGADRSDAKMSVRMAEVRSAVSQLAPKLNRPAQEAKFALRDGSVTELQGSRLGSGVDLDRAPEIIAAAVADGQHRIPLPVAQLEPRATAATIGNLGIRELVAVGTTNFAGSPVNRRHNIAVAADLLNGTLIAPGEEFSLIQAVGPVDASLGYRKELVIKGDRTIPEFGGGLCQIGTTMFRLVLNAGLPILERQNHSYRVRYYEPPVGMDATIYEPKPDFRFRNDYASHLLLQTRIEGDNLIFEFWGTKDGRVASTSQPKVSNIVPPPPKLTIETTELAPGEVKCTEKPHPGSDAVFTYTVTYADGRNVEMVFKSKYRPWREVCLVGVKSTAGSSDSGGNAPNRNANQNVNGNVNAPTNTNTTPVDQNVNTNVNAN